MIRIIDTPSHCMTKTTKEFKSAYTALNAEQKKAVDTIDGPVMLVAGPGTGKTQTLALRIANILQKTDTSASSILALTFTESGARAMKNRLIGLIGVAAYDVTISTFHSFCTDVIKQNPTNFTIDPSGDPLSELEKFKLIYALINSLPIKEMRPINAPYHYVKAILKSISDLKREGVSPVDFDEILAKEQKDLESSDLAPSLAKQAIKTLAKNHELSTIYHGYQDELALRHTFDFEDMISLVSDAFIQNEELLRTYQERYQYILVDEYQDTNSAQNKLVSLLTNFWGEQANIFVVGDPEQAIYRFQGASIENMLGFVKDYPSATVITLNQNYRSTQNILDASASVISNNSSHISDVVSGLNSDLFSSKSIPGAQLTLATLSSETAEAVYLATTILSLIKNGTKPSEIVVIYRANADAKTLSDIFVKYGLDYTIQGGGDVLADPIVLHFLKILRVIHDLRTKEDDLGLFTILNYNIFHIDPLDVLKLSRYGADHKLTLFDVIASPEALDVLELQSKEQILSVLTKLSHWSQLDANSTFVEFFEKVLSESGYLNWVLNQTDAHNRLIRLNTLFSATKQMNAQNHSLNLSSFLDNIALIQTHSLRLEESSFAPRDQAVVLTTAHSAKGLEWEHVFIYKIIDGAWGNNVVRELIKLPSSILPLTGAMLDKEELKARNLEDERRLFYVALTRAKSSLTLTLASSYSTQGKLKEVTPSLFLAEIDSHLINPIDTKQTEDQITEHLAKILSVQDSASQDVIHSEQEKAFLTDLVDKFSLSATALNTYLECSYLFKLNNLLKIPRAKAPYLAFGTAVHVALESFLAHLEAEGHLPAKDYLLTAFVSALKIEIMTPADFRQRKEKGEQVLSVYYDFFVSDFPVPLFLEKFTKVHLGDITLTGKIDRIEWLNKNDHLVRVVDYKTGKSKTKGQIMGTTQDSRGDLHRQLVFYKLLIDLDPRLNFKLGEAQLDFVQAPLESGKSGRHNVAISDSEVGELKQTIMDAMKQIRALHFPRTSDLSICAKCDFKDHCYPNGIPSSK